MVHFNQEGPLAASLRVYQSWSPLPQPGAEGKHLASMLPGRPRHLRQQPHQILCLRTGQPFLLPSATLPAPNTPTLSKTTEEGTWDSQHRNEPFALELESFFFLCTTLFVLITKYVLILKYWKL
jgi:hypothetical protein